MQLCYKVKIIHDDQNYVCILFFIHSVCNERNSRCEIGNNNMNKTPEGYYNTILRVNNKRVF